MRKVYISKKRYENIFSFKDILLFYNISCSLLAHRGKDKTSSKEPCSLEKYLLNETSHLLFNIAYT